MGKRETVKGEEIMIHEISIVVIYATFVVLLMNSYTKRVDKLEDRIDDLESNLESLKDSLYIVDNKEVSK